MLRPPEEVDAKGWRPCEWEVGLGLANLVDRMFLERDGAEVFGAADCGSGAVICGSGTDSLFVSRSRYQTDYRFVVGDGFFRIMEEIDLGVGILNWNWLEC